VLVEPSPSLLATTARRDAESPRDLGDDIADAHVLREVRIDEELVPNAKVEIPVWSVAPQLSPALAVGCLVDDPGGELLTVAVLLDHGA